MKFVIFGTGEIADGILKESGAWSPEIEIVGVIDNDEKKQGTLFYGKTVSAPNSILYIQYDYICILLERGYEDVYRQLLYGYHIEKSRLSDKFFLLKQIMNYKYQDSSDEDIRKTISYWSKNKLSFFNQFEFAPALYEKIYWDMDNNMPYAFYGDKRLYYPRNYRFFERDDGIYAVSYRDMEQHKNSPHRYLTNQICIRRNDIVIDAGAREGDFALPYIDMIQKLYLFECDTGWIKALEMTYKDYKDKVVIIPKMLSDQVDEDRTTLSAILGEEKIDFIKMDIEGAEVETLRASQTLLKNNDIRCAICCYHRRHDKEEIETILKESGYECSVSNGYVVFVSDPDIFREADFRRGIVYAEKRWVETKA